MNNKHGNPWQMVAVISTIAMEFIFLTIGGAWLGRQFDVMFQTKPICLVIGIFLGLFFGFASAIVILKKLIDQ